MGISINNIVFVVFSLAMTVFDINKSVDVVFFAVDPNERVDCAPKVGEGKLECLSRGCIWDKQFDPYHNTVPLCYFPPGTGYGLYARHAPDWLTLRRLTQPVRNPYGKDIDQLDFRINRFSAALHIAIGTKDRYRPPVPLNLNADDSSTPLLSVQTFSENGSSADHFFYFTVTRKDDKELLWDTSIGGLLFSDQFIQIATYLPSDKIYGFGQHSRNRLKHDFSKYTTWGMFSRDQSPVDASRLNVENTYGVHPFYLGVEPSGKAHGVLIFNSNAQEVTTGPAPHLIYRTIGGQLDLFFFPGPSAEQVIQQYHQLVGLPYLPPYWALGYQFSRFGYNGLADLKATIGRIRHAQIPLDVVWADIDYMDRYKDFTVDEKQWSGLGDYVKELHGDELRFVPILDPGIQVDYEVFQRALRKNASFVEWARADQVQREVQELYPLANGTKIMLSVVWPDRHVAFPDFLAPENRTQEWWTDELKMFHDKVPFDGIWIDMNEPSSFSTNKLPSHSSHGLQPLRCPLSGPDSAFDNPPYETINVFQYGTQAKLSEKTLCMLGIVQRDAQRQYNTHSLYGWAEMVATRNALDDMFGKRSQLLTRSSFVSSGRLGSLWTGDNNAEWADIRASVIGIIESNFFGFAHVGADVCGFNRNTTEELCLRWQQLGAFYPFFRNHNSNDGIPQDPTQWESVMKVTRVSNLFRYHLLPTLYSLHYRASLHGGTVVRPLFFDFPHDFTTYSMDRQFLWGSTLMVVPVLDSGVETVRAYFPQNSTWFSISNAHKYGSKMSEGFHTLNAPMDTPLPVFLRAGAIIPTQQPETTTVQSRKNRFHLKIALDPSTWMATGELFWDDGDAMVVKGSGTDPYYHFQFTMKLEEHSCVLAVLTVHSPPKKGKIVPTIPSVDIIEVLGHPYRPDFTRGSLSGKIPKIGGDQACRYNYNTKKAHLKIECPELIKLAESSEGQSLVLKWQHQPEMINESNDQKWIEPENPESLKFQP